MINSRQLFIAVTLVISIMSGCSSDENKDEHAQLYDGIKSELAALAEKHETLGQDYAALSKEIDNFKVQNEKLEEKVVTHEVLIKQFPTAWPAAQQFLDAYFSLDFNTMREMLSDQLTVGEESVSYVYSNEEVHIPHVGLVRHDIDYTLSNFSHDLNASDRNMIFVVRVRTEVGESGMVLKLQPKNNGWEIVHFEFSN